MISPVLGMWLLGVGAEAKRVLTVPKRFFRKSLQINRLVNRGGESSLLPDKTAHPTRGQDENIIRMPSHTFPRVCVDESQVPEGRIAPPVLCHRMA